MLVFELLRADDLERLDQQGDGVFIVAQVMLRRRQVRQAVDPVRGAAEAFGDVQRQQKIARAVLPIATVQGVDAQARIQHELVQRVGYLRGLAARLQEMLLGIGKVAAPARIRALQGSHFHAPFQVAAVLEIRAQALARRLSLASVIRQPAMIQFRIRAAARILLSLRRRQRHLRQPACLAAVADQARQGLLIQTVNVGFIETGDRHCVLVHTLGVDFSHKTCSVSMVS